MKDRSPGSRRRLFAATSIIALLALLAAPVWSGACKPATPPQTTAAATPAASVASPNDADADRIADSTEDELMSSFAPLVRLHPDERYLPADVSWFFSRVKMAFDVRLGTDDQILPPGQVTCGSLVAQTNKGQVSGFCASQTPFFLEQVDASGKDSLDTYRQETRKGSPQTDWVCYAHVRFAPSSHAGMYDVQYIFFYAYNGDMAWGPVESAHEADFEHITVRVESDLKTVHAVYYAAHDGEGKWYSQASSPGATDGYSMTAQSRPIVFSGLDSHASYPWAAQWKRSGKPDDFTEEGGTIWDCAGKVVNLGEKGLPRAGAGWLQYSGRWGEIGQFSWTTGPYGPAYQSWWGSDPE